MHDNKVRLSPDVIEKAQVIAAEWGLKNARAAVEAVFRKYADEYLYGRLDPRSPEAAILPPPSSPPTQPDCEALSELEDLLAL